MENKVLFKGVMDLGGMQIPCYVLDNGVRVLSGRGMQESLKMVEADEGRKTSGTRLVRYLNQKSLKPFISKYLGVDHFVPLKCMDGGHVIYGYRAEALADICDAFLEARKNIQLSPRQEVIASQCETLMRAFARVGIIALVDEVQAINIAVSVRNCKRYSDCISRISCFLGRRDFPMCSIRSYFVLMVGIIP